MKQNKAQFIFSNTNIQQIQQFLDRYPDLNIIQIKDQKNNNIIHRCAFKNKFPLAKLYLDHQSKYLDKKVVQDDKQKNKKIKKILQQWINQQNSQGFTPLHYAAHKGDIQFIKFLQKFGANLLSVNKTGLNVLHLAAQGNKLKSMIIFHQALDLNSTDNNKMTSLHWAASMGSEQIAEFLLAQPQVLLNQKNNKQETPLHLATAYGNTKIVRMLLFKGAKKELKNSDGDIAIQIAKKNQFSNIFKMLNDDHTFCDQFKFYCNVQIKYKPTSRSVVRPITFILALIYIVGTTHVFIQFDINYLYLIIPAVYYLLILINYITLIKSPKLYRQSVDIYSLIQIPQICSQCKIPKKPRSYHCQICKVCIQRYDHHCPWINNCVGKLNIGRFILFLTMLIIAFIQIIGANVLFIIDKFAHFRFQSFQLYNQTYFKIIVKGLSGINAFIALIFLLPMCPLLYVQISNVFLNRTTYQRFSKRVASKSQIITDSNVSISDSNISSNKNKLLNKGKNPKEVCSLINCRIMCSADNGQQQQD